MPTEFLSREQAARYGTYNQEPDTGQLARYFHVDDADMQVIASLRGDHNRLGFALQLGTLRFLNVMFDQEQMKTIPSAVVGYVARQLRIADPTCLTRYTNKATHYLHQRRILKHYSYQEFGQVSFSLTRWLYERAWLSYERPSILFDLATAWLVERRVLLPGVTTLERLVARVRERVTSRMDKKLFALLKPPQIQALEQLLVQLPEQREAPLQQLRRTCSTLAVSELLQALVRLNRIRELGVSGLSLREIPAGRVKAMARFVAEAAPSHLSRLSQTQRLARLLCFARHFETQALDESLDLLDALLVQAKNRARASGEKTRLRSLRDLDGAALTIALAIEIFLDERFASPEIRTRVYAKVPRETVQQALEQVKSLTRPPEDTFLPELLQRYRSVRKFLLPLLEAVDFQSTQAGKPLLQALEFLKSGMDDPARCDWSQAPQGVISSAWKRHVIVKGELQYRAYTLCLAESLQEALLRRDVFVSPSERWGDPRAKLLSGSTWEKVRPAICRVLGREVDASLEISRLGKLLGQTYQQTLTNLPQNSALEVDPSGNLSLARLDKLAEPASLVALRQKVERLLPRIDLPDLVLEMNLHTGFANEFSHASERQARAADLEVSLCAALIAQACNTGLEPVIQEGHPALSRDRLEWVLQNYLRAETITAANAKLVAAQSRIPLAQHWGGGEVASADGIRFVVPERTLHAGYNRKYFNSDRGITYYNFASNQFTGLHGIVIPGTTHEAPYLLEGVLEQQTPLSPTEVMTDTAAYSDILFGLFWLLGYQFSPRLADIGAARFWRMEEGGDYGPLNTLSRHHIRTDLIANNWDDLLRLAASLKMGTISASELIRTLLRKGRQRGSRHATMTRALAELGRIPKTLYLLRYIDDESYRRRILLMLNRHEKRHALARAIFHANRGELRQRYKEGQEDQLGALGLMVNLIILWNTLYMNAALEHLRSQGEKIDPEDIARLWPLSWEHINLLGRYSFRLSDSLRPGQLRPLLTGR